MTARTLTVGGWVLVVVLVVTALAASGDSPSVVLAYLAMWSVSTTLPGVLVWRGLCRPAPTGEELGFGSVLGVGLLLLTWVPATLVHRPWLMWLLPLVVTVAFTTSARLRCHWRTRPDVRHARAGRWHAAMMVVVLVAFLRLWATRLRLEALPPRTSTIFQDEWYEIGLAQHLTRTVGLDDPAAAGVPLHYHWFSNAHIAATQLLSRAPLPETVLHLWPVMMLVVFVFSVAEATDRILESATGPGATRARPWWPGPLAAALAAACPVVLQLGATSVPAVDNGFVVSSTSGLLALVLVLTLVGPVLDVLAGHRTRGTWTVLALLLMLSAGTKPSILPVVACGSALVTAVHWVCHRVVDRVALLLTVGPLVLASVASIDLVGSTGGSRVQLLDTLTLDSSFLAAAGHRVGLPGHGGWLTPALAGGDLRLWGVAGGVLLLFTLTELPRLLGVLSALSGTSSAGVWWCSGVVWSGWCGLWLLAHPGYSQHYFWRIVIGLGVASTVATLVLRAGPLDSRAARAGVVRVGTGGLAIGIVAAVVWRHASDSVLARLTPYAVAGLILLLLVRRRRRATGEPTGGAAALPTTVLAGCFLLAAALPPAVAGVAVAVGPAIAGMPPPAGPASRAVSRDEQLAALWLHDHSPREAVVATNVFCAPRPYRTGCPHTAFWVAALTGRQLWLGSWAYTQASMTAYGRSDIAYQSGPSPWPDRLRLSLRAVRDPNDRVLRSLGARGVTWIYADRRSTEVSARLDRLCTRVFSNRDVAIYRLPDVP